MIKEFLDHQRKCQGVIDNPYKRLVDTEGFDHELFEILHNMNHMTDDEKTDMVSDLTDDERAKIAEILDVINSSGFLDGDKE